MVEKLTGSTSPKCPKCDSDNTFRFEKDVYLSKDDKDLSKKPLYGCNDCKEMFVLLKNKGGTSLRGIKGVSIQQACANLSKGCMDVLGQIK
jgi:transposase-like protein